ncbi:tRNA 2-selenouridine(34) synthase MnmH [Burkholderia oklahomensis]|uniref:tRNA 2-selenouridine synthase n=1 Tax=Burkholderia oklahomensis TaxID=342113 RepID=A0AAI8FN16_9BURK|nr:tRNA 2-selenouridine(34) synthase MnmH [Burkholderia oklahomensis]AIO67126.1 tRNA 2-selenouridine synthase [Burkholderia oklahomensis]AOI43442.1 tRNA 2-selenouridine synthase [Burkholderia oklahomensis EO147]KUY54043.1 tRNA 2-selenouridine synthase [Burkholderia oklahomensis EO147]QPS38194.1 tRNA 2-selenouridine(34) synthase MnmH [Burkholderia oklahomensis]
MNLQPVSLDQIDDFDEIVDVRTPLEYAEDHIPGALNAPVLSNEERVIVGTMYKQVSPFEATRVGAAMVARNIAAHLDTTFADRPRNWRPLVYCWRGGKRSGSMTVWFNMIGWRARQLDGGYKSYRRSVVDALGQLPSEFRYVVLTGNTGSGKTRLLHALAQAGAQTLDLEALAAHRGSLLGALPSGEQPSQKAFDTALVGALRGFDREQPVFIEAESRRIGAITLPLALLTGMRAADCVNVETERDERVALLLQDYGHLFDQAAFFKIQLEKLVPMHGHARIRKWHEMLDEGRRGELFEALVDVHYDPAYTRSSRAHFVRLPQAEHFPFRPTASDVVEQAKALLAYLDAAGAHARVRQAGLTRT